MRFLPCADFEELQDALWFGLDSLTVRQGKIDPRLTDALRSPVAVRRAAAACIVGRRGDAEQRAAVQKLLSDAEPEVRLRAAQGLLAARDKTGVPALIALLEGSPVETAWQAEELLRYVAGEKSPAALVGAGAAADRTACRQAWESWWKGNEAGLDFAKLDGTSRRPGLMLLCDGGLPEEATGRVWLLGCDGVTRWDLRKLSYPSDARLLPGGRVVVAERSLTPAKPTAETGVSARIGWQGAVAIQGCGRADELPADARWASSRRRVEAGDRGGGCGGERNASEGFHRQSLRLSCVFGGRPIAKQPHHRSPAERGVPGA